MISLLQSSLIQFKVRLRRKKETLNMACKSIHDFLHFTHTPKSLINQNTHIKIITSHNLRSSKLDPLSITTTLNTQKKKRASSLLPFSAGADDVEETNPDTEEVITGEWPDNFSLLSYDDLRAYLEPEIFKEKMEPSSLLGEVMSATVRTATVDQTLGEIDHHFEIVSGLPVIDSEFRCIGVVSKKDKHRASNGLKSKVGEIMSSPAITLTPDKTVLDAAVLMLKEKFHRIPVVNEGGQVVGIVTRTDIFIALEGLLA